MALPSRILQPPLRPTLVAGTAGSCVGLSAVVADDVVGVLVATIVPAYRTEPGSR